MRADEFARFDAVGLADIVRRRAVSATGLLDAAVDAIDRTNPMLNAVVRTDVGRARAAIAAGLPEGRFTGVPFLKPGPEVEVLAGLPADQGGHPLLVTGRTAVWTSDIGPHGLPQTFVDWPGYAMLWSNLLGWVTAKA